jgi:hypothetical protein
MTHTQATDLARLEEYVALLNAGLGPVGTGVAVFLASLAALWFFVGITKLWDRFGAYNYALGYESLFAAHDPNSTALALQVGVIFRNVGPAAISYEVKDLRVVVGSTTIGQPNYLNSGGEIPRGLARCYRFPPFPQAHIAPYVGTVQTGTVEFTVLYGPAKSRSRRQLHMKLSVTYRFDISNFGIADTLLVEEDSIC